jgi:hypothetical protein
LRSPFPPKDEGTIVKRERLTRSNNIFLSGGPSFTLGKNIGDYSSGFNGEAGFVKRVNRVLSIGGSLCYLQFKYDPEKTGTNNIFRGDDYIDADGYWARPAIFIDFKGGTINLMSLSGIIKVNFVPVKDDSKFSIYGFAKPFIAMVKRTEVNGNATYFEIQDLDDSGDFSEEELVEAVFNNSFTIEWDADSGYEISDDLKEDNSVTGGIMFGPGVELYPGKKVTVFLQASIGYTFPVSFISTEKYEDTRVEDFYEDDQKFPMTKEGFPSVNIQAGVSFNF